MAKEIKKQNMEKKENRVIREAVQQPISNAQVPDAVSGSETAASQTATLEKLNWTPRKADRADALPQDDAPPVQRISEAAFEKRKPLKPMATETKEPMPSEPITAKAKEAPSLKPITAKAKKAPAFEPIATEAKIVPPLASEAAAIKTADDSSLPESASEETNTAHASGNVFLDSLHRLHADDIAPARRRGAREWIRLIIILVCIVVLLISVGAIAVHLLQYRRAADIYDKISGSFNADELTFDGGSGEISRLQPTVSARPCASWSAAETNLNISYEVTNTAFELLRAKLDVLTQQNPDTYGWIHVPNTNIDYPIVQSADNDYYLNYAFNGEYLPAGSIFADFRCSKTLASNYNLVLYGHNMNDGTMFHDVTKYLDETFFAENPYLTVTTADGIFTYEVFAIYRADMSSNYNRTAFATREEVVEFAELSAANSLYQREGISFTGTDRILTLSTCTSSSAVFWRDRYALQAKLIRAELAA